MSNIRLLKGDCIKQLKKLEDNSVDSVVTDPPYHLTSIVKRFGKDGSAAAQYGTDGAFQRASKGFMGKEWDGLGEDGIGIANNPELWKEVLRVLKPGGHLLSFSHSRTYHRQAVAVEDAGFEIRDQIMWVYGSGFPKSHNIGKAVDKLQGNEREVVGTKNDFSLDGVKRNPTKHTPLQETLNADHTYGYKQGWDTPVTKGTSPYEGWGTALKPAHEPIVMARKPFKGSVAQNVLEWGTGGINIDGCRIKIGDEKIPRLNVPYEHKSNNNFGGGNDGRYGKSSKDYYENEGRFPANIIFDEEAGKILDEQSGKLNKQGKCKTDNKSGWQNEYVGGNKVNAVKRKLYLDEGGASRFFYCPKASKKDRNEGCDELEDKSVSINTPHNSKDLEERYAMTSKNNHPTVKPTDLMAYLVRLVTPKGGTVLDPFMGSGSTGKASVREGMDFIGIEREDEYMEIAKSRIEHEQKKHKHREFFDV